MTVTANGGDKFVVDGVTIIVGQGETREEAINRTVAEHNAMLKEKQIAQRRAEADRLNGRKTQ